MTNSQQLPPHRLSSGITILAISCAAVGLVFATLVSSPLPERSGAPLAQATVTPTVTVTPTSTPTSTPTRIANSLTMRFGPDQVPIRAYSNGDGTYSLSVVIVTPVP